MIALYIHILKRHIASVHERKKPFVSDTYDARFASKYDEKGHISSVHEGKKVFKCANCDACYKDISSRPENKIFRCDATFTQKANFNLHKKSFHESLNCNLKIHIKTVHEEKKKYQLQQFRCFSYK